MSLGRKNSRCFFNFTVTHKHFIDVTVGTSKFEKSNFAKTKTQIKQLKVYLLGGFINNEKNSISINISSRIRCNRNRGRKFSRCIRRSEERRVGKEWRA